MLSSQEAAQLAAAQWHSGAGSAVKDFADTGRLGGQRARTRMLKELAQAAHVNQSEPSNYAEIIALHRYIRAVDDR